MLVINRPSAFIASRLIVSYRYFIVSIIIFLGAILSSADINSLASNTL